MRKAFGTGRVQKRAAKRTDLRPDGEPCYPPRMLFKAFIRVNGLQMWIERRTLLFLRRRELQRLGFYANRWLEADSDAAARLAAIECIDNEIRERQRQNRIAADATWTTTVESVVIEPNRKPSTQQGWILFPDT